jgi:hypothetical protein
MPLLAVISIPTGSDTARSSDILNLIFAVVSASCYDVDMSKVAKNLTNKFLNYLNKSPKKDIKNAALAIGVHAALKYLHYQSAKNIYQIKNPK